MVALAARARGGPTSPKCLPRETGNGAEKTRGARENPEELEKTGGASKNAEELEKTRIDEREKTNAAEVEELEKTRRS